MSRSYRHIQECNKEIIELKHNGCPVRQKCEKFRKNTTPYYLSAITPAKASPICLYPISDGCTQLVICRSKCSEYILLFM